MNRIILVFMVTALLLYFNLNAETTILKKGEKANDFDAVEIFTKTDKRLSSVSADYCLVAFYYYAPSIVGLKTIYAKYKAKGLEIYAVCFCDGCDSELARLKELEGLNCNKPALSAHRFRLENQA